MSILTGYSSNPGIAIFAEANREVLRITPDGRMILGEGLSQDEATQATAKALVALFEQQFESARKDSERLDWLWDNADDITAHDGRVMVWSSHEELRSAIDAAREAKK